MLTRCPYCETAFRVTADQLTLRQGKVRCGACREVFNALESLADEAGVASLAVPATPVAAKVPEDSPVSETPVSDELTADVAESRPWQDGESTQPEPEAEPEAEPEPEPESEPEAEPEIAPEAESAQVPAPEPDASILPAADLAPLPETWETATAPPPRPWPWAVGATLLLLLAVAQLLYIYRIELAVRLPEARPLLAEACAAIGCELPRPRQPGLVGIESSDLAPDGSERLLLTASLRNRAPFAQDYPYLELTLTDTRDSAIVRKILKPADYLSDPAAEAAGFAAHGDVAVRLLLEAQGVPAVGYRLYLFYP